MGKSLLERVGGKGSVIVGHGHDLRYDCSSSLIGGAPCSWWICLFGL